MNTSNAKMIRIASVMKKIGVGRSTIYDWINPKSPRYDATFPKRRRLGKQSIGWLESEIDEWILLREPVSC
ncbi:AlpA family phage regulatory protein [Pantoea allii]|jgi:prophage regulatory protein|uniref:AlpA family phage regulatory protein n=2 Tax=Enterobacterales TaxID=91347 RepID=A0A291DUI2_9ENTR|nr:MULTISPECIES: AlpA family phage regulatory protein [Enterobacterales]HBX2471547.1 AlpA family phage regulatory protein [Klebsiella pneumoniae]ATF91359.1 AlpA family phage regulatory protein [Cedecea neteri]MBW1215733.1 AlpA family phage regulatory protein [Pantoea allii]MBW1259162.1 AlpA family phage regulatory protein [Pantoea allii]MBW1268350.1 AlpA family phage regulatory protein [Pantoea allii]